MDRVSVCCLSTKIAKTLTLTLSILFLFSMVFAGTAKEKEAEKLAEKEAEKPIDIEQAMLDKENNYHPSNNKSRDLIFEDDFYYDADGWTLGTWTYEEFTSPYYIKKSYGYDSDVHSALSPSIDLTGLESAVLSWNQSGPFFFFLPRHICHVIR